MNKTLSEMSLEELWQLFPIQLAEHQTCWENWYQIEKDNLLPILPGTIKIHHIGSTSINGIWAKPIIDILMETNQNDQRQSKVSFYEMVICVCHKLKRALILTKGILRVVLLKRCFIYTLENLATTMNYISEIT